jgi:hypothetical protein
LCHANAPADHRDRADRPIANRHNFESITPNTRAAHDTGACSAPRSSGVCLTRLSRRKYAGRYPASPRTIRPQHPRPERASTSARWCSCKGGLDQWQQQN